MRWYLEKPGEPRLVWDATFDDGDLTVRTGAIGADLEEEFHQFADLDEAVAAAREMVSPLFADGYEQSVPPEDRYKPHPRIASFWNEELLDLWKAMGATEAEPTDYRDLWVSYLATELPPDLDQYLQWRSNHAFGYLNFGEWRMWDVDRWLPTPEDGNLFEQLVLSDQQNYLGTAMMEHFASWVYIGSAGNGDGYYAHPNHADPNQAEVVFFDHETHSPDFYIADSVASLAWLNHCYCQLEGEDFDHDGFGEDFALIEDRTTLSWHYGDLEEEGELEPSYEGQSRGIYYFYRAIWLDMLLRPSRMDVEDIDDVYYADFHAALKFEDALKSKYLTTTPITALYWIWRLFWFDKPELEQCLEVVADHPSPIVRDCVALVRELLGGRKTLGEIDDIFARREAFLALDLDPDRAEARAAEEAAAAREAELRLAESLEAVHALIANASTDEVREALWDYVDQTEVLDVLYEHLKHTDPDAAPWITRYEFMQTERDREYRFEREEFAEVVGHGGGVLAPRFIGADAHAGQWILAAHTAGDRLQPRLLEHLDTTDKYNHSRTAAIRCLQRIGANEVAPKLIELTQSLRWEEGDWEGKLYNKDAMLAAVEALAEFGGDEAIAALVSLLDAPYPEVHPRVLVSLGRMGAIGAADRIAEFLTSEAARPALCALGHLGDVESVDAHVATLAGGLVELAYERAMQQLARKQSGAEVDFDVVVKLTTVIESKRFEDIELHEALIDLLMEHESGAQIIQNYLHHEYTQLREAADVALMFLDAEPGLRLLDRPTVDALFDSEGADGLRAALTDRNAIFGHNVLWKAVDEGVGEEIVAEACDYVRFLTRFTHYTNGYVQDEHKRTSWAISALAQIDTEDSNRLLCRLWKGTNAMYSQIDTFKYDRDDIQSRLQPFVAEIEKELAADAPEPPPERAATAFANVAWLHGGCVNGAEWAPDGAVIAVGGEGGVKLLDRDGNRVRSFKDCAGAWVYDVAFSPDGKLLAVGAHAGHLWLFDPETGEQVAKLKGHRGVPTGVRKMRFSPSGKLLASVSDDQTMRVWDVDKRECVGVWEDPADVNTVDWVDEATLVIGTDRMIRLISADGKEIDNKSCSGVAEVRVNRDRGRIYVGNANKKLRAYSLDLKEKRGDHLDCAAVARIRFRADDLVAVSWEGEGAGVSILSYDGKKSRHLDGHHAATFALDLNPNTGEIAAGGRPGTIARWTSDGEPILSEAIFHTDELASMRFCGDEVVTSSDDRSAVRWTADGEAITAYANPDGRLCDAIVDGEHLFVTGSDFSACFTLDGEMVWRATPERSEHLTLTADSLVVATYNRLMWLDRKTGEVQHETEPFADSFIFRWARLDDRRLAVAGYDDECLHVWDLETREQLDTWHLPAAERGGVCHNIALGAGRIYVSRWDKSVVVLDAENGAVLKRAALPGTRYPIGVSADGSMFYAASGGRVEVYNTSNFEHIETITVPAALEELAVAPDGRVFLGAKSGEIFVA